MVSVSILKSVLKPEQLQKLTLAVAKHSKPLTKVAHKYGPEILTGTGIVGGIGTVILASRATLKLEPLVDKIRDDIDVVREGAEVMDRDGNRKYDDALIKRTVVQLKIKGALDIAKLYAPAIGVGVASVACVLGAHGIMKRRNVALVAAYGALEKSFEAYRARVKEEIGEEREFDIRHGFTKEKVKDEETGKTKTVTKVDPNGISIYARFFDQNNSRWEEQAEYNMIWLRAQQNWFNDLLHIRGHLFLNEVYDGLGMEQSQAGQFVGWYMHSDGDNYVDFGIYDFENDRKRMFVNGLENGILLDFNVDGVIIDKIAE